MLQNRKPRHYLAQFYGANDNPQNRYRKASIAARALYPTAGIKSLASLHVRIVRVCETGAIIQANAIEFLPDHFYLCLGDNEIFFTCAKKNLLKGALVVAFAQPEDTFFIDALTKVGLPLSTLKRMRGPGSPTVQTRTVRARPAR